MPEATRLRIAFQWMSASSDYNGVVFDLKVPYRGSILEPAIANTYIAKSEGYWEYMQQDGTSYDYVARILKDTSNTLITPDTS